VKSLALRAGALGPLRFGVAQTGNETTSDLFLFVRPDYKLIGKAAYFAGSLRFGVGPPDWAAHSKPPPDPATQMPVCRHL
jgi:hypothetical protein